VTLVTAAVRNRAYVVQGSDRACATADLDGSNAQPDPTPPPLGPKARQISDWATVSCAGCVVRSAHFLALLAERVAPDDDVDVVAAAAAEAFGLVQTDPVPYWTFPDGQRRPNSAGAMVYGFLIAGFRRDGTGYLGNIHLAADRTFRIYEWKGDNGEAEKMFATPLGAAADETEAALIRVDPATLDVAGAAADAFDSHRAFRRLHSTFVSETFELTILRWRGEGMKPAVGHVVSGPNFLRADALDLVDIATSHAIETPTVVEQVGPPEPHKSALPSYAERPSHPLRHPSSRKKRKRRRRSASR